eukprot:7386117-Prymnesium_polylepis.2
MVVTVGPSDSSSAYERGARRAPGCRVPDIASVTSLQLPLLNAGERYGSKRAPRNSASPSSRSTS